MRIGLVSYEYPPQSGFGGVGTYAYRLAGALGRVGHEVVVLAGPTDVLHEWPQENVTLHRIEAYYDPPAIPGLRFFWWRILAAYLDKFHRIVFHWLKWNLATKRALLSIHARTPLDVIEAPEHAANGLVAGRLRKWPMVVRLHGPWDLFFGINRTDGKAMNRLLTRLERMSCDYADIITAPSKTMAAFMRERWSLPHMPMPIANFMDVPAERAPLPSPTDGPQRIVCAGRIERFKGQDTLVKAFARIAHKHPRAELMLIGPDQWSARMPFERIVDQWAPDADVRRRIVLMGPQPLAQVQEALASAAVAVVCSAGFESFSFSTLEAMAAGRPIVASRVGAIPELLENGACGLTAAPGNVAQFADGIDRLLSDRTLSERLAAAAHARARRCYDTAAVLPQLLNTFQRARELFAAKK